LAVVGRGLPLMVGAGLMLALSPARAENLDAGKSPQALFTGTCSACNASPRGLGKNMSASGIASFLREHYTASPQSAAAIAAYVASAGPDPRAKEKEQAKGREAKQPEQKDTAATRQHAAVPANEAAKGKQTSAHRPELDERLPQAHDPREAQPEEPKKKDRQKKQEARTQEPKETTATPAAPAAPEPEPTPARSAAPPAAEPPAVSKAPVETPDQPAFSVPSP